MTEKNHDHEIALGDGYIAHAYVQQFKVELTRHGKTLAAHVADAFPKNGWRDAAEVIASDLLAEHRAEAETINELTHERPTEQAHVIKAWGDLFFEVEQTGGGCEALIKREFDSDEAPEAHIMITGYDAALPDSVNSQHVVGLYETDLAAGQGTGHFYECSDMNLAKTGLLAMLFLRDLRQQIGSKKYARVIALNYEEKNPSICHSHDFCDANECMITAFAQAGIPCDIQSEDDCRLFGDAWTLAKDLMQQDEWQ